MALQKTKTLSNGVSGNYWKITAFTVNKMNMEINYVLELFKDASFSSIDPVGFRKEFTFSVTNQQLASDLTSQGYSRIKSHANTIVTPEVEYQAAIPAVPATYDQDGNELTPEIPEVPEVPFQAAVYKDADLQGAIDV